MGSRSQRTSLFALAVVLGTGLFAGGARAETVYVSNEKDNTISVIDSKTDAVTDTIPVGHRPRGIVLSRDNSKLFICASDDNEIEVLDLATKKVLYSFPTPDPELLILAPDGHRLYVSNEDDNMVTVFDVEAKQLVQQIPVGVEPEGMGMSPDGSVLVNTSETTNMAHFIDTKSLDVTDNVLVDARPRVAMFTADGKQVWVSAEVGGTVRVLDAATHKLIKRIEFKIAGVNQDLIQAVGVRLTKDGKYGFVALGPSNHVAVVDAQKLEVIKYLLVGQRVWQLAFTPDQKKLYTTNGVSNDVSVIDVDALKVTKSIPVGRYPWGVVVKP
jgi:PQQ-dependent catabolism-associated beta-propeller protein